MATNSRLGKGHNYQNRPSNIILPKSKSLSVQTIKTWKDALELASLAENPNRAPLMELYGSILLDSHLASIIESRTLRVIRSKFKMVDASGKDNPDLMKLLETQWFNRFLYHAMSARFRGSTVIELWDLDPETLELVAANYIPSENVLFEDGLIVKEVGDEQGYPYKEGSLLPFYLQVGTNHDLGLLKNVAPDTLSKKFAKAAWVEYVEKYGIPPRWVTTDSYSDTRHNKLAEMMASMVSNHWAVLQGNETIDVMPSSGTDAYNTFDKLIERMNSEMSKRVLGQDGTTNSNDNAGTFGSLKVMQEVAEDRHESDKTDIRYLINDELLWRLEEISPVYKGITNYRFDWDESKELTPDELIESVGKLSLAGYDVDIKYLVEKTGIPILQRMPSPLTSPPTPKGGEKKRTPPGGEKKKPLKQSLSALISNEITAFYATNDAHDPLSPFGGWGALDISNYTKLIEKIARDLHSGKMQPTDLNEQLVRQTYKDLSEGVGKGYGKDFYNYERNAERKLELRQNLYKFSGAKNYQQTAKLNFLLQGDDGNPRPFPEFKKEALKLNEEYNRNYLRTEFQTSQRAGAQAEKWGKYEGQKALYPNLQYKTAGDKRVRDDHDDVADVIKPIDDKFWDTWYPPNGWNCRCYVVQTSKGASSGTPPGKPTMGFHNNVGKSGSVFDGEHPYFIFPKKEAGKIRSGFEELKLQEPMYDQIYKKGKAKLEGSLWSDPADIENNIASGKILVSQLNINVKIRPHVNPVILKNRKNPEFEIRGNVADLKNIRSNKGITNGFDSARQQMGNQASYSVIFNLDGLKKPDITAIQNQLNNKISPERGKKISSVFFTYKGKAAELKRGEIVARQYEKLIELLK